MKKYIKNRFYFRGFSWLGIFNTFTAFIFNRVVVLRLDSDTKKRVGWFIGKGTDFLK